jgi:hypothetical protein
MHSDTLYLVHTSADISLLIPDKLSKTRKFGPEVRVKVKRVPRVSTMDSLIHSRNPWNCAGGYV